MRSLGYRRFLLWALLLSLLLVQKCKSYTAKPALTKPPLRKSNDGRQRHISLASASQNNNKSASSKGLVPTATTRPASLQQHAQQILHFIDKYMFLVGMFVAVGLARIWPALGRNGGLLRPELVIGKFGVALVFLLSGLSLELSQLTKAFSNVKLNLLVQSITFVVWPLFLGLPLTHGLNRLNFFPKPLLDGVLIMMSLPTTVNMCVILTSTAGGNVASALCHAVLSNLLGIFLTPALLFYFFGSHIQLPFVHMLVKLSNKVLLPVAVGQALRTTGVIKGFCDSHSKLFKRLQEFILLSILWNAFCTAFSESMGLELKHGLGLLVLLPTVHAISLGLLLALFSRLDLSRGEVVAAAFCASQKTLAFGLPLVNTIFEGSPNLAAYCAPVMLIHPMQLIVGSILVPRLQTYINAGGDQTTKGK